MYPEEKRRSVEDTTEHKQRKSKRKRMDDYGFLKPVYTTKYGNQKDTMEELHYQYAALCDIAYKRNQPIIEKALLNSGMAYRYRFDLSSPEVRVFEPLGRPDLLISAFKSSTRVDANQLDATLTGDVATDLAFVVAYEKTHKPFKRALQHWNQLYETTSSSRHILIGHSLGAALARYVFEHHKTHVYEVHTFMPRSGLSLMATEQRHYHTKYITHYMLGDPLQLTGVQADAHTNVYMPQDAISHAYLLKKILNTD
jgi:hypothetical protein